MTKLTKRRQLNEDESGMATLEALPLLVLFIWLIGYCLGLYGVIHSAIMHSIGSRAYAFETFRNRANLTYFKVTDSSNQYHYLNNGMRLHGVLDEKAGTSEPRPYASQRPLFFGREPATMAGDERRGRPNDHNTTIFKLKDEYVRSGVEGVNPAWIQVQYGICINSQCGG